MHTCSHSNKCTCWADTLQHWRARPSAAHGALTQRQIMATTQHISHCRHTPAETPAGPPRSHGYGTSIQAPRHAPRAAGSRAPYGAGSRTPSLGQGTGSRSASEQCRAKQGCRKAASSSTGGGACARARTRAPSARRSAAPGGRHALCRRPAGAERQCRLGTLPQDCFLAIAFAVAQA